MAWNDQGGDGKDDDPWGGRRGEQGPPDLDEAMRKLQAQLSGIFGGRGGGGEGGGGFSMSPTLGAIAVFALIVVWAGFGIYQLDQSERGVVFRFGAVIPEPVTPGLRWNPPLVDEVYKVNVTRVDSIKHRGLMLTEDENIVDVSLTVQFRVTDPVAWVANVKDPRNSLVQATESALRHVVGSSTMDSVITDGRAAIALEVQDRVQSYVDLYGTGVSVSKVNIDESAPPSQVQGAFDEVQRAKEDENTKINDANTFAESILPRARGAAQKALEEANAYREQVIAEAVGEADRFTKLLAAYQLAPEVTRERLYIDTLESVFSNSSKVMIDVDQGNNLLYLPLDQLGAAARRSAPSSRSNPGGGGSDPGGVNTEIIAQDVYDRVVQELREQVRERNSGARREAR